jgi:hypothetical protein
MDTEQNQNQNQNQNVKRISLNIPLLEESLLDTDENTSKKRIVLTNSYKKTDIKNIQKKEKEKKMRVETNTWGLDNDDLAFETQLELLRQISDSLVKTKEAIKETNDNKEITNKEITNKERQMIISHIKTKLSSYKQQDILKKKYLPQDFVSYNDVIGLLTQSNMKCYYCSCETYLLYEIVREMKQWSLDRINNDIGHNKNNLVICCLECNLKRRRTNEDAFFFTKNLKIQKME